MCCVHGVTSISRWILSLSAMCRDLCFLFLQASWMGAWFSAASLTWSWERRQIAPTSVCTLSWLLAGVAWFRQPSTACRLGALMEAVLPWWVPCESYQVYHRVRAFAIEEDFKILLPSNYLCNLTWGSVSCSILIKSCILLWLPLRYIRLLRLDPDDISLKCLS